MKLDKMKSEKVNTSSNQTIDDLKELKSAMNRKETAKENGKVVTRNTEQKPKKKTTGL